MGLRSWIKRFTAESGGMLGRGDLACSDRDDGIVVPDLTTKYRVTPAAHGLWVLEKSYTYILPMTGFQMIWLFVGVYKTPEAAAADLEHIRKAPIQLGRGNADQGTNDVAE